MMKLSTMQGLIQTLDEQGGSPVAEEILSCWQHDPGTARFFRASANFIFTFENQSREYILRFNHAGERTPDGVQAELDVLNYLASQAAPIGRPVRSLSGKTLEIVRTSSGRFLAAVFEKLRGFQYETPELPEHLFVAWGRALGELHRTLSGFHGSGRPSWREQLSLAADTIPHRETAARNMLDRLGHELNQIPVSAGSYGLIHFDFELDNLLWEGDRPGVVDFNSCAWYWYAADIAFALRDLFADRADRVDPTDPRFLAFIEGYRQAREIAQVELDRIPLFLKVHNLVTFADLERSLDGSGQSGEPGWLAALRRKLMQKQDAYRQSFIDYLKDPLESRDG